MLTAEARRGNKIVIHTDQDGGVGAQRKLIHEALTEQIIGAAMEVHKALGPGCWNQYMKSVFAMSCT